MPLLDSHWCKLTRAREHLDTLNEDIAAFLQPDSYSTVIETDERGEFEGRKRSILRRRVFFSREPDVLRWGTMVGDIVVNLRAALDHVVYAISVSRDQSVFINDRSTEFPITDQPDAFHNPRRRNPPYYEIRGLPSDAKAIVEGLQPYHRRQLDGVKSDRLWLLREMSNIDKHRSLHISTWSALHVQWDITHLYPGTVIHSSWVRAPGVLESGASLAEIDLSYSTYGQPSMEMNRVFQFTVALDEALPTGNEPMPNVLTDLWHYVFGVVSCLDPFVRRE
ncbi:MAG: hypothetical protein Q8M79_10325 [Dehalococcoidia bacterium]|nr:hypothetical protein [Dehalococcoidia bacterium]